MLKALQKSVEEEEQVWKARVSTAEEELREVRCPRHPGSACPSQAARAECHQSRGDNHRVIWVTWGGQVLVMPHEVWLQKDSTAESWSPGDPTPRKRGWSLFGGQGHHGLPGVGPRTAARNRGSVSPVRSPRARA